jgi:glucose-1-phosphate cytidylyltransferase
MVIDKNLSVIILIGGRGSRFSKINEAPKQLIILNKKSLLENQMKCFIRYNVRNFILPLGYKSSYFLNFFKKKKTINNFKIKVHHNKFDKIDKNKINILLFNGGKNTSKLKRIKNSLKFIENNNFFVTYGDGIGNINLKNYFQLFNKYKKAIVACRNIKSQFGHLKIREKKILSFDEKPILKDPINIGYYFFSKEIFNKYYKDNYELEGKFVKSLIRNKKIIAYNHKGFFFNIDRKIDLDNIKTKYRKLILTL